MTPRTHTSLDAVTAAANGSAHIMRGEEDITVEIEITGQPTLAQVVFEGRIGTSLYTQHAGPWDFAPTVDPETFVRKVPKGYYGETRLRLVDLTGGSSPTVTGTITDAAS